MIWRPETSAEARHREKQRSFAFGLLFVGWKLSVRIVGRLKWPLGWMEGVKMKWKNNFWESVVKKFGNIELIGLFS